MQSILVVDDEQGMREFIEAALEADYDITLAKDGGEALLFLADAEYDLVITDIVMPGLNGINLLKSLLQFRPGQKIIAISGGGGISGRFDYLPVAKLLTDCEIMQKPFGLSELRQTVEAVLAKPEKQRKID